MSDTSEQFEKYVCYSLDEFILYDLRYLNETAIIYQLFFSYIENKCDNWHQCNIFYWINLYCRYEWCEETYKRNLKKTERKIFQFCFMHQQFETFDTFLRKKKIIINNRIQSEKVEKKRELKQSKDTENSLRQKLFVWLKHK